MMNLNTQDIFLIPHGKNYVLHAPLHGVTSYLNASAAEDLYESIFSNKQRNTNIEIQRLIDQLRVKAPKPPLLTGSFAPNTLNLLTTNDCNMRCLYCAPGAGSSDLSYMSRQIGEAALSYQADIVRRNNLKSLAIYYFGGEPLLPWDFVQFCDAKGRDIAGRLGVNFIATCTTNAYLSESHAQWIAKHFAYAIVSLDGPAEIHDHYRRHKSGKPTHHVVTRSLKIFESQGLPYALRCSIDRETVKRVDHIVSYFCEKFRPDRINIEPLVEHGRSLENGLRSPDPASFIRAVVRAGRIARAHGIDLKLTTAQIERISQSNCAIAEDNFVVAPDGLVSSCFGCNNKGSAYSMEYAIGDVDTDSMTIRIDRDKMERSRSYGVDNIPRCRDCFCKWHCSGGCRLFHTPPFCDEPPSAMCAVTQRLTLWRILERLQLFDEADRMEYEPMGDVPCFS